MSDAGRKILDGLKEAVEGNFSRVHIPDGTGKLQTWVRLDAYEALMAAARALDKLCDTDKQFVVREAVEALAKCRAAGLDLED